MVVYVDGKPIFVQNPKGNTGPPQSLQQKISQSEEHTNNKIADTTTTTTETSKQIRSTKIKPQQQQPITKIPYLLAAAAAAAASNPNRCTIGALKKEKNDHEYQHLVSLFKQKNEKLFNPLQNPLQNTHDDVPLIKNSQNNSVCL
jgi:hypothetical protein